MALDHPEISVGALNFVWGMLSYTRSKQMKATTARLMLISLFFDSSLLTIRRVTCEY